MMMNRMDIIVALVVMASSSASSLVAAAGKESGAMGFTTMSYEEKRAFEQVAQECNADVERICRRNRARPSSRNNGGGGGGRSSSLEQRGLLFPPPPPFQHSFFFGGGEGDREGEGGIPTLSFPPLRHPLDDLDGFLDHFLHPMMTTMMMEPPQQSQPQEHTVWMVLDDQNNHGPNSKTRMAAEEKTIPQAQVPRLPCPLDRMIHDLVAMTEPQHFEEVTIQLNQRGQQMLEKGQQETTKVNEEEFSTARRLQAITPEELHKVRKDANSFFLPFSIDDSECLLKSKKQVSSECNQALSELYKIRQGSYKVQQFMNVVLLFVQIYFLIWAVDQYLTVRAEKQRLRREQQEEGAGDCCGCCDCCCCGGDDGCDCCGGSGVGSDGTCCDDGCCCCNCGDKKNSTKKRRAITVLSAPADDDDEEGPKDNYVLVEDDDNSKVFVGVPIQIV